MGSTGTAQEKRPGGKRTKCHVLSLRTLEMNSWLQFVIRFISWKHCNVEELWGGFIRILFTTCSPCFKTSHPLRHCQRTPQGEMREGGGSLSCDGGDHDWSETSDSDSTSVSRGARINCHFEERSKWREAKQDGWIGKSISAGSSKSSSWAKPSHLWMANAKNQSCGEISSSYPSSWNCRSFKSCFFYFYPCRSWVSWAWGCSYRRWRFKTWRKSFPRPKNFSKIRRFSFFFLVLRESHNQPFAFDASGWIVLVWLGIFCIKLYYI